MCTQHSNSRDSNTVAVTDLDQMIVSAGEDGKTTVETIQAEIVRRICFLDYPPGCQLKEADLAEEFGVSRTPVRDAISRIKHLGLIETRNGVGTVVVALSSDQVRQVYEMRLQLATLIGEMPHEPITEETRQRATELLVAAKTLKDSFDPKLYVALNHQLHNLIAGLIGNSLLKSFWQQAYYQAASTWYHIATAANDVTADALVSELQDINEALGEDDVAAVGYIQRIHIGYGFQRIKRHLLSGS